LKPSSEVALAAEDEDKQYNDELTVEDDDKQYNDELTAEDDDKQYNADLTAEDAKAVNWSLHCLSSSSVPKAVSSSLNC
jgi:hypothetical protein